MNERTLIVAKDYLTIPVYRYGAEEPLEENRRKADLRLLLIRDENGATIYRFVTPWREDMSGAPDYYSCIPVERWKGQRLTIASEQPAVFLDRIGQSNTFLAEAGGSGNAPSEEAEDIANGSPEELDAGGREDTGREPERPRLHYTAPQGWINDPNGMVFQNGHWHLYYQHNPLDTGWANMSWGHAVSEDLVHFHYEGDVLFPDEHGAMFSGCGLVNQRGCFGLPEDALLFFYTASADGTRVAPDDTTINTQRMAYSLDGGKTLEKYPDWYLENLGGDNRDPKVFWHEESQAYIMVLFLKGHSFAILRSEDLAGWKVTQQMTFDPMWECPDLEELTDGQARKWAFLSADGFYYIGSFDGYTFTPETPMQHLYDGPEERKLPYAGQTFSNAGGRVIQMAWLRVPSLGSVYTGAMSLARELSLGRDADGYYIRQAFVPELQEYEQTGADGTVRIGDTYLQESISPDGRWCTVTLDAAAAAGAAARAAGQKH